MQMVSWLILGLLAALMGCAPAISPALQQESGPKASFAELSAHPDWYLGQTRILGGEVMQVQPLGQGSLLSMDQHDLDSHLFPGGGASGGTFLVESDEWLNPTTYQPKSKVTVAGVVAGQKNGLLLLKARQIHYWEGPSWEKWYYPVPREWYNYDPNLEYWFTPPYFDPWRGGSRR
jgi:starvation-inducible outer membrane lipoprotein